MRIILIKVTTLYSVCIVAVKLTRSDLLLQSYTNVLASYCGTESASKHPAQK